MFKVGDWVQVINNPEIVFQIEEFHHNGIVIHDGLMIEERFLKPYEGSFCPICGEPEAEEDEQPQPGTHIITVLYKCGAKVDYPLGSDEYMISKRCDFYNSWFPDEVDYKLENIINDRYEHYHTVDNTTGYCVTCGENVDNPSVKEFKSDDAIKDKFNKMNHKKSSWSTYYSGAIDGFELGYNEGSKFNNCTNCKHISTKCDIFKNNYIYLLETRGLEINKNKWTCGLWELGAEK